MRKLVYAVLVCVVGLLGFVFTSCSIDISDGESGSRVRIGNSFKLLERTLVDEEFYVSAQSHVPIYFSTNGGTVSIQASSDRKVEFITMNRYDYDNRVSLLLGYEHYPALSAKSTYMNSKGELPEGDYVLVVQCVGLHINTRNVHVTITESRF